MPTQHLPVPTSSMINQQNHYGAQPSGGGSLHKELHASSFTIVLYNYEAICGPRSGAILEHQYDHQQQNHIGNTVQLKHSGPSCAEPTGPPGKNSSNGQHQQFNKYSIMFVMQATTLHDLMRESHHHNLSLEDYHDDYLVIKWVRTLTGRYNTTRSSTTR